MDVVVCTADYRQGRGEFNKTVAAENSDSKAATAAVTRGNTVRFQLMVCGSFSTGATASSTRLRALAVSSGFADIALVGLLRRGLAARLKTRHAEDDCGQQAVTRSFRQRVLA